MSENQRDEVGSPTDIGVADAKRHFSELIQRVSSGERVMVSKHGKPVMLLTKPTPISVLKAGRPVGLAAAAGVLADWPEAVQRIDEAYATRKDAHDRDVPNLSQP